MNGDRRSEPDARMLRRMVRELADEPLPELEWEGIEARLFAELEEGASRAPASGHLLGEHAAHLEGEFVEPLPPFVEDEDDDDDDVGADRPSAIPAAELRDSLLPREALLLPREALPAPRPAPSFFARSRLLVVAAAIAAGLGGLFVATRQEAPAPVVLVAEPIDPASVPQAPGMAPGVLDARSLHVGDVVEAALGPLAFGSLSSDSDAALGALSWTLSAGSRALVHEPASAIVHVVELESGSIRAEASGKKRIVIRAADTEIASVGQGAVFTVTRSSRGLVVHVEVGSVLVGERGGISKSEDGQEAVAASSSRLLSAPTRVAVSLDGSRVIEVIPDEVAGPVRANEQPENRVSTEPEVGPAPVQPVRAPIAVNDATPAPNGPNEAAPPSPPQAPTVAAPAPAPAAVGPISEASIRANVQGCFAQVQGKKAPNEGVAVSVSSTMRVTVRDDGSVQGVVFNPPLQSDLQSCAVFLFRENLGPGARSLSISVAHR